jgi:hypothetical protein
MSSTTIPPAQPAIYVDPRAYGAVFDVWTCNDGQVAAGTLTQVNINNPGFAPTAVRTGNPVVVRKGGAAGADLITTIAGFTAPGTITLATACAGAMTNASLTFGSDDAAAINVSATGSSR